MTTNQPQARKVKPRMRTTCTNTSIRTFRQNAQRVEWIRLVCANGIPAHMGIARIRYERVADGSGDYRLTVEATDVGFDNLRKTFVNADLAAGGDVDTAMANLASWGVQ